MKNFSVTTESGNYQFLGKSRQEVTNQATLILREKVDKCVEIVYKEPKPNKKREIRKKTRKYELDLSKVKKLLSEGGTQKYIAFISGCCTKVVSKFIKRNQLKRTIIKL